jgi:hypothetical protein
MMAQCGCEVPKFKYFARDNTCTKCSGLFCPKHIYTYVDESNIAITKNAPKLCEACYRKTYK